MRTSMAYFAGVGTVIVAIGGGLGGGLLIANIVNPPRQSAEMTKLEQRMSSKPISVVEAPSEPVPYVAATEPGASAQVGVPTPAQNRQQAEPANAASTQAQPAGAQAATNATGSAPPAASAPQPAAPVTQAATSEQTKAPEDAFAKARPGDVTRDGDVRRDTRRAEDRRKADRRQQWTERRRYRQPREQELEAVEAKVREETEPGPGRTSMPEPVRLEMPRIRLFDPE